MAQLMAAQPPRAKGGTAARTSQHVARMFAAGLNPSAAEIGDEANATEKLATARRELLNAISHLLPARQ